MIKLKIESIGTPKTVTTKFGPKEKNFIKVEGDYSGKFLNYWCGEGTKSWKVGDVIEVESVEKREYTAQDGTIKNSYDIKLPRTGMGEVLAKVEKVQNDFLKFKLDLPRMVVEIVKNMKKEDYPDASQFDEPPF